MQQRRSEDHALRLFEGLCEPDAADDVPHAALGWLREVIRSDFPEGPERSDGGADPERRRRWLRLRTRASLPGRLARCEEALWSAPTAADVHAVLVEQVERLVDVFACLLFPPGARHPLASDRLGLDGTTLSLPLRRPVVRTAPIREGDVSADGPLSGLAPLFAREDAAWIAYAPFGKGGALVLVERRREREMEPERWEALRALVARAEVALERLRVGA